MLKKLSSKVVIFFFTRKNFSENCGPVGRPLLLQEFRQLDTKPLDDFVAPEEEERGIYFFVPPRFYQLKSAF